jgi:hypothetical protein
MIDPNLATAPPPAATWPATVQAISAGLQVLTAIAIVWLTRDLAKTTRTYASLTKLSLDLNTKQYQGDFKPMWHLTLYPTVGDANNTVWMRLVNLSRNSARITHLLIRVSDEDQDFQKVILDNGLAGHREMQEAVQDSILHVLEPHLIDGEWNGLIELAVAYHGWDLIPQRSETFPFKIVVRDKKIKSANAKMPTIIAASGQAQ